ncbi:MAG: hypothetical protein ABI885_10640, partial [Gammaproteobacteria bacterium]
MRPSLALLALAAWLPLRTLAQLPEPTPAAVPGIDYPGTITLAVDATDVMRGVFTVHETIPVVSPGPLVLLYPQWLPGNHSPTGPIEKLAALSMYAGRIGRNWRPLLDTTNDPIIARRRPNPWRSWQRGEDYYSEGHLIWLDVDTRLRELAKGKRSLDDFAKRFFGMKDGTS